jgi:hypothetical protein
MEFWKEIWGYEACISLIRRQKDILNQQATYSKGDLQYSSRNTGITQVEIGQIEEYKNTT